jgi:hypothetical protein
MGSAAGKGTAGNGGSPAGIAAGSSLCTMDAFAGGAGRLAGAAEVDTGVDSRGEPEHAAKLAHASRKAPAPILDMRQS